MRLLKRQPGLPFLLALGVLLILSASFLAVQLWSENAFRGAAEALEAPMLPPPLPVGKKGAAKSTPGKKNEQKPVATVEVVSAPEVQESKDAEVQASEASPVVESTKAPEMVEAPAMPLEVAKPAPSKSKGVTPVVKETVAPVAKPVRVEPVSASGEKPVVSSVKEVPVVNASSIAAGDNSASGGISKRAAAASSKKVRAARKAAEEVDESKVPSEWNWFNTPLKLEINDGNVEIVSAGDSRSVELVTVAVSMPVGMFSDVVEPLSEKSETDSVSEVPATAKPFVSALARMAKLRYGRMAAIEADPELEKAAAAHRSRSLEDLRLAIASLRSRLEAGSSASDQALPVAASENAYEASYVPAPELNGASDDAAPSLASEETVVDAGADEAAEFNFAPYYSGSGTAMSNRINTLLQRGIGYSRDN